MKYLLNFDIFVIFQWSQCKGNRQQIETENYILDYFIF